MIWSRVHPNISRVLGLQSTNMSSFIRKIASFASSKSSLYLVSLSLSSRSVSFARVISRATANTSSTSGRGKEFHSIHLYEPSLHMYLFSNPRISSPAASLFRALSVPS